MTNAQDQVNILINYEDNISKVQQHIKELDTQIQAMQGNISKASTNQYNQQKGLIQAAQQKIRLLQTELTAETTKLSTLTKLRHDSFLSELKGTHQLQQAKTDSGKKYTEESKAFAKWGMDFNKQILNEELTSHKANVKAKADVTAKGLAAESKRKREEARTWKGAWFGSDSGSTFGHKFLTTAQYGIAGTAIFGVASAMGALSKTVVDADLNMRTMAAVLDLNTSSATLLSTEVRKLGETYGGTTTEIEQVALALGRAGVKTTDMVDATEVVLAMARLTGDTFEQSASAVISFQQVFGNTTSIQTLGDKLAYIANVSRLSTQDIGTFSNYALAAAKDVGLTEDAVGGLAAAFSNAGVNASTIGTQIRRFTTLLTDDSEAVSGFFKSIGVNQKNLLFDLQKGGETSNKAILNFVNTLTKVDKTKFTNLTGQMDILAANSLALMRNNSSNINKFIKELQSGVANQLENTKVILASYIVTFESMWNTLTNQVVKAGLSMGGTVSKSIMGLQLLKASTDKAFGSGSKEAVVLEQQAIAMRKLNDETAELEANRKSIGEDDYLSKNLDIQTRYNKLYKESSDNAIAGIEVEKMRIKLLTDSVKKGEEQTQNSLNFGGLSAVQLERDKKDKQEAEARLKVYNALANVRSKELTNQEKVEQKLQQITKLTDKYNAASVSGDKNQQKAITDELHKLRGEKKIIQDATKENAASVVASANIDSEVVLKIFKLQVASGRAYDESLGLLNSTLDSSTSKSSALILNQLEELKAFPSAYNSIKTAIGADNNGIIKDSTKTATALLNLKKSLAPKKEGEVQTSTVTKQINLIDALLKTNEDIAKVEGQRLDINNTIESKQSSINSKATASTERAQRKAETEAEKLRKYDETKAQHLTSIAELEAQLNQEGEITLSKAESTYRLDTQLLGLAYERYAVAKGTTGEKAAEVTYLEAHTKYLKSSVVMVTKQVELEEKRKSLSIELTSSLSQAIEGEQVRLGIIEKSTDSEYEKLRVKIEQGIVDRTLVGNELVQAQRRLAELQVLQSKKKDVHTLAMEYQRELQDQETMGYMAAKAGLASLESGMMNFFDVTSDGWLDWHSLASSVLTDIYKQLLQQLVIKQLVSGIAGGISSGFGNVGTAMTYGTNIGSQQTAMLAAQDMDFATGGMIPTKGYAKGGVLSGGSGIRDDIYLGNVSGTQVFAMGGEFITRKDSVNAETKGTLDYINKTGTTPTQGSQVNVPVSINIENQTGQAISADMMSAITKQNQAGDYEKVINIILKASQTDPRMRSMLKGR